ncbi:protein ENHANCED DOWNY MILDEW 2 [Musa acuminata AAA Group]|uniref:protein ENHANCED DOWNY MILDEW 2 n=1 Tax=Musa acuminata AAA Group TaxID=214697 RepID=UPI0031E24CFF
MASSDDDEIVPQIVTNYHLVDDDESPISFSVLPVQFSDGENQDAVNRAVFLHGTTDGGLQKVYKQVVAWKLVLEDDQPKIMVLSKDKKWINLLKPRKSYEDTIRTMLITIQLLHFLRRKPQASEKSLWEHLRGVFSTFEVRPSEDDFREHISLMKLFRERDQVLVNSQLLLEFLEGKPRKKFGEVALDSSNLNQPFIADDDEVDEDIKDDADDDSEDESDLFDSVCAICDNGGELLCCEGPCLRSFHATRKAGEESECKSLGYTKAEVESLQNFLCNNCLYKQHQCFGCGKLGASDKSKGAEVYPCVSATCGHFYHPKCVSELLFPGSEAEASEFQKKIVAGESFTCPVHKCVVCKQGEDKEVRDLQFAMCRRCPKSYHRKCLPRRIAFEDIEDEAIIQRAWDDLLPNRILIYCLKHTVDEDLGTPRRNHIIFPETPEKKIVSDMQKSKIKELAKNKVRELARDRTTMKSVKATSSEGNHSKEKVVRSVTQHGLGIQKKEMSLKDKSRSDMDKAERTVFEDNKTPDKEAKPTASTKPAAKTLSSFPHIDSETEAKVLALFEKASSSLSLENITRKRSMPSTHAYGTRHIDKTITQGKVEGSVEAIRTALQKLENGGSVEDAKAVCEPEMVKQLLKWREKLRVYLAPFLHGMRYTSFGRHFTKVDKLKQIVDKLQWYVQDGDTVVDFCCGANDYSILMKEKLDAAGKRCYFKNYDIIQPKNDFNFERRDWMKVNPKELPTGSKLIMGLNPPFGVKAALANKFIDKALTFKPKLLILIVPKETERLDKKSPPYDLIWEDGQSLSGKSFYLPGSVDVNDKQMEQWNLSPPPLYLWSRADWTTKHKTIASHYGHTFTEQEIPVEESLVKKPSEVLAAEDHMEQEPLKGVATSEGTEARKEDTKSSGRSNKRFSAENRSGGSRKRRRSKKKAKVSEAKEVDKLSDISISPDHLESRTRSQSHLPSEPIETPSERANNQDVYFSSGMEFGVTTGGNDIFKDIVNDDIDEIARRYTAPAAGEGMFNRNSHVWPTGGIGTHDYGVPSSDSRFSDYPRSNIDSLSRNTYSNDIDGYRRISETDLRAQIRLYGTQGQDEWSQRNGMLLGSSDSVLGQPRLFPPPSYGPSTASMATSAMDRYAPRLDEANYVRPRNQGPVGPLPGTGSIFDYDIHGMRRDRPPNSIGFAPGPHPSYPHPGTSGGWLDE